MKNKIKFNYECSKELKGIAIIIMMLHHCFRVEELFEGYSISFYPFKQEWIVHLADMSKICVSIFAFITGYGLYISYKNNKSTPLKWTVIRYIKTFSGYWLIWILSLLITQLLNSRPAYTFLHTDIWSALLHIGIDFLGLSNIFNSPTLLVTWWYMSACFVFIVITPLLVKNEDFLIHILFFVIIFVRLINGSNGEEIFTGFNSTYAFLTPFIAGMIFSKYDLVEKITNAKYKKLRLVTEIILLMISYFAYQKIDTFSYWEVKWGVIPIITILFSIEFVSNIPIVKNILMLLGKHSMNIYMVHNFIRGDYFGFFTYSWKHFVMVIIVLLISALIVSILIETLKKIIKYDNLVQKICNFIKKL